MLALPVPEDPADGVAATVASLAKTSVLLISDPGVESERSLTVVGDDVEVVGATVVEVVTVVSGADLATGWLSGDNANAVTAKTVMPSMSAIATTAFFMSLRSLT